MDIWTLAFLVDILHNVASPKSTDDAVGRDEGVSYEWRPYGERVKLKTIFTLESRNRFVVRTEVIRKVESEGSGKLGQQFNAFLAGKRHLVHSTEMQRVDPHRHRSYLHKDDRSPGSPVVKVRIFVKHKAAAKTTYYLGKVRKPERAVCIISKCPSLAHRRTLEIPDSDYSSPSMYE